MAKFQKICICPDCGEKFVRVEPYEEWFVKFPNRDCSACRYRNAAEKHRRLAHSAERKANAARASQRRNVNRREKV